MSGARRFRFCAMLVCALLVVAGCTASHRSHEPGVAASSGSASAAAAATLPANGTVSASELASYRWTALPRAPITPRLDASSTWTGRQMLIWGGIDATAAGVPHADGASYDPSRRTWQVLPPAPLSARQGAISVWTGQSWFLWGGTAGASPSGNQLADGATYTPATRTWTRLPPAPIPATPQALALWTGSVVLLIGATSPYVGASEQRSQIVSAAFDPAHGTWAPLPSIPVARGIGLNAVLISAVATGPVDYLWVMWSSATRSKVDAYELPAGGTGWRPGRLAQVTGQVIAPLWDGRDVLVPEVGIWCGHCPGPFQPGIDGVILSGDGTHTTLQHGPVWSPTGWVWTGKALLGYDNGVTGGSKTEPQHFGAAEAWNPDTGHWTVLPNPGTYFNQPAAVWTGTSLLLWGYASGPQARHPTGLQFAP